MKYQINTVLSSVKKLSRGKVNKDIFEISLSIQFFLKVLFVLDQVSTNDDNNNNNNILIFFSVVVFQFF